MSDYEPRTKFLRALFTRETLTILILADLGFMGTVSVVDSATTEAPRSSKHKPNHRHKDREVGCTQSSYYNDGPYDLSLFESERWRRYWIGKSPRIKNAVTEYLKRYRTQDECTQGYVMEKYGTGAAVRVNINLLKKAGLIDKRPHWTNPRK